MGESKILRKNMEIARIKEFRELTGRCLTCGLSKHEGKCNENWNETTIDEVKPPEPIKVVYTLSDELKTSIASLDRMKSLLLICKSMNVALPIATKLYDDYLNSKKG